MKQALGLIETVGLTAAIDAADTALKAANVALIGYELSRGGGMTTVKIQGDVGAVEAAIAAAAVSAAKVGRVCSTKVIPRPAEDIDIMMFSADTVGLRPATERKPPNAAAEQAPITPAPDKPAVSRGGSQKTAGKKPPAKKVAAAPPPAKADSGGDKTTQGEAASEDKEEKKLN